MTFVNYLIQIILVCIHFTSLCRSPTDCTPIYSKCITFLKPIPHTNDSTTPSTASSPTENNIELACEMKLQHCWYSIHIWISTVVKNPLKASIYLLLGIAVLLLGDLRSPVDYTPIYSSKIHSLKPILHTNDNTTPSTASSSAANDMELASNWSFNTWNVNAAAGILIYITTSC